MTEKKAAAAAAPKTGVRVALNKDGKPKTVGNEELKAYDVRSVKDNSVFTFEGEEANRVAKCTTVVDGKVVPTYFTDAECEGPFAVGTAEMKKAAADAAKKRAENRKANA
jgi:hypothetical protein